LKAARSAQGGPGSGLCTMLDAQAIPY